jgi:hypothetical protein
MQWGQEKTGETEVLSVRLPRSLKRKVLSLPNSSEQVRSAIIALVSDNVISLPNRDRTLPD